MKFWQPSSDSVCEFLTQDTSGGYVVAEDGGGREVLANREAIGPWETFRLFNRTRPGEEPRHGDSVVLQAWNGRFLSAAGGGGGAMNAELGWIEASTTFTIERVGDAGAIRSGDQVALRAANGNYVVAEGGGGGAVNANRTSRGPWETFTIKIFRPQLIRLRSSSGRYVSAEGGGGAQATANREAVGLWETFSLVNLSRPDRSIRTGDPVALRAWNGNFVRVARPNLIDVRANQATPDAIFRIGASGSGVIEHGQRLTLNSSTISRFVVSRAGELVADGSSATADAQFTIEFAERAGIGFEWVPDGASFPDRPFASAPSPASGERNLLVLHFFDDSTPRLTASNEQLSDAIYGRSPSLASWLETMSSGAFRVRNAGLYGPIRVRTGADHNALLTAAEEAGVPLTSFVHNGAIARERHTSTYLVLDQAVRYTMVRR
jgi:hypothetical protein